jgi:PPK2 family polyphosphate:nucleotide phosphotransferase
MKIADKLTRFRITDGKGFRLADHDCAETLGLDKEHAKAMLKEGVETLSDLQEKLYAQDRWAVLAVFQAMDAAGKDSAIKHVMSGVNPQGCQVFAFKAPSEQELDHDFLWRTTECLPERGRIGIFNRSYYEEVLVVRVRPELLARQKLPPELVTEDIWQQRFEDIRGFERQLARNGTIVLKFFLHVSKEEQRQRFLARLDEPAKNWKFSLGDLDDRKLWDRYMAAYEDMIRHTAAPDAPWWVVPADKKWFARLVVAAALVDALAKRNLHFPEVSPEARKELAKVREALLAEGPAPSKKPAGKASKASPAKPATQPKRASVKRRSRGRSAS